MKKKTQLKKIEKKKPAVKTQRAKLYEPKLKVHGTFADLVKVAMDVDKQKRIGKATKES